MEERDGIPEDIWEVAGEICSQIAEFGKPAQETVARAIKAERDRVATKLFDRCAFMVAVLGDGDPYVKISFPTLAEMSDFHHEMVSLSKAAIRNP